MIIDVFSHFALGFVLGELIASVIVIVFEKIQKRKERKEWEDWKNKLP